MKPPLTQKDKELFKTSVKNEIQLTQNLISDLQKVLVDQNFAPREVQKTNEMIEAYQNRVNQLNSQLAELN